MLEYEDLLESEAGTYSSAVIQGVPGRNYFLKVVAEGKTYDAVSSMPQPVEIEEIRIDKFQFNEEEMVPKIKFWDSAGVKNFYRAINRKR